MKAFWWYVQITAEMTKRAIQYEREVLSHKWIRDGENYSGVSDPRRFYKGHLGEQSFEFILKRDQKRYIWTPRSDGYPDQQDFVLFADGHPGKANVKAAARGAEYSNLLIPVVVFNAHYADIYIGGHLLADDTWFRFDGWAAREDFEDTPPVMFRVWTLVMERPRPMPELWSWIT
jgi:hypothetical protein